MVPAKRLKALIGRTYLMALGAIALLCTLFFAYNHHLITSLDMQPAVINIAGKQRMLSQRIALLQASIYYEHDEAEQARLKQELGKRAQEFFDNHEILVGRKPLAGQKNYLSEAIENHYFGSMRPLDTEAKFYAERAIRVANGTAGQGNTARPPSYTELDELLTRLDQAVSLFEQQLAAALLKNQRFSFIAYIVMLSAMLLTIFKMFKPLENLVFKHYHEATKARHNARQQKQEAKIAAKARSDFFTKMSHEFRSPLAAVIGVLELLPNVKSKQGELISKAEQSCYRLLHLTNNLTDSMVTEQTEISPLITTFDLVKLIDDSVGPFANLARHKKIALAMICDTPVPQFVHGPPEAISKALKNVIDNAIRYTNSGAVDVFVSVKTERKKHILRVCVADTGPGIPANETESIFTPFTQGSLAIEQKIYGMGIGLSIARGQLQQHGGTLSVKQRPDQGSEFILKIPLAIAAVPAPARKRVQQSRKFAVIDDMQISRMHLANLITAQGYEVETFASGTELLTRQSDIMQYQALVLDFYMPGLSGTELSNSLQTMYGEAVPPIIFVSATPVIANLVKSSRLPVWQTFVKPIDHVRFTDAICHLATQPHKVEAPPSRVSILIVEDEPINRELMQEMLTNMGFDTHCATNGKEAVELCQRKRFDVVLLDISLPDFSGIEIAQILRKQGCTAQLIAVTASAFEADKEATRAAQIRYHLVKPVSYQELKNTIKQSLLIT